MGPTRTLFGHPAGLTITTLTEGLFAAGIYAVQSMLVLYMAGGLFAGTFGPVAGLAGWTALLARYFGAMPVTALATQTMGLYLGIFTLAPLLGGWLGDRVLGPRRTAMLGAGLTLAGLVLLIWPGPFLPGLLLGAVGGGILRCALLAQTGHLYARDDGRRDAAFSILATGLNVGAFLAPLVIGALGETRGWPLGFGLAAAVMALAFGVLLGGNRLMPLDVEPAARASARLAPGDGRVIAALLLVMLVTATFWVAQSQVWNSYNLWVRDHLDRRMFGFEVPVTWLQAIDSLAPILAVPAVLALWRWQAGRGRAPGELAKIGIGCALIGAAFAWLALGAALHTPFLWAVVFHLVLNTGWLYVVPTVNALFSRTAPRAITGLMLGASQFGVFLGSSVSGWLGRFYDSWTPAAFWWLHAAIPAGGALAMWWLRRPLGRMLAI